MNKRSNSIVKSFLIAVFLLLCIGVGFSCAAEVDDSSLFVDAFNAYQKKDYLLSIEKIGQLAQSFPDSPLRDISLLLLSRAGLRSGDNELAVKSVNQFLTEFDKSSLKSSIEDELFSLRARHQKGEKLTLNKTLRTAAQKVRNDQIALERALAEKVERERLAREKAERERIAFEKAEAERKERERLAAEKTAKESIRLAISLAAEAYVVPAGESGLIPFEVVNKGRNREEFVLSGSMSSEYGASLRSAAKPDEVIERLALNAGESFKGFISLRVPANKIDGFKAICAIKAVSVKFADVNFSKDVALAAMAPLVRAVLKPLQAKAVKGETVTFRAALLNAGSMPAGKLTLRIHSSRTLAFSGASDAAFVRGPSGDITWTVDGLDKGAMLRFALNFTVLESADAGQEARCSIEVVNDALELRETFSSPALVIQAK